MTTISNRTFDEERALYNIHDTLVSDCTFSGPADGESVLKECTDISVKGCSFDLRYPFWHDSHIEISGCSFSDLSRAAIWYTDHAEISDSKLMGIKALRECHDISLKNCTVESPEFGWSLINSSIENCSIVSEYFLMRAANLKIKNLTMQGKYSFQYVNNATIEDSNFDTKDAFWHSDGITVRNSTLKGEYLGWYSDHLTLINCKIIGTQPFCYCKNLKLIDCEMIDTDLSFEKSDVEADIIGNVYSIKNPHRGYINAGSADEVIIDDEEAAKGHCKITLGK